MTTSQSAHNLVAAILNYEDIINTACTGQNPADTPDQYRFPDKEVRSLFNRGRHKTGQAAVYQANLSMPSTSQECPTTPSAGSDWQSVLPGKCQMGRSISATFGPVASDVFLYVCICYFVAFATFAQQPKMDLRPICIHLE